MAGNIHLIGLAFHVVVGLDIVLEVLKLLGPVELDGLPRI